MTGERDASGEIFKKSEKLGGDHKNGKETGTEHEKEKYLGKP